MPEAFVGRQPIFNRKLETIGAELEYRSSEDDFTHIVDVTEASSSTVVAAFTEIGIDNLVGRSGVAYVKVSEDMLRNFDAEALPPTRVVIEVLDHVRPTPKVRTALKRLKGCGHKIALSDFVFTPSRTPLLEYADVVKIEAMDKLVIRQTVAARAPYNVVLLAVKLEDQADMRVCADLGFELFQGHFLCKPEVVSSAKLPASRATMLELVSKLNGPAVEFSELVDHVSADAALSYRLLRYLNSAHFALRAPLTDIRQAMGLLGYNRLRAWVSLVALSNVDDKPAELVRSGIVRARMCELLAARAGVDGPSAFTVGLLSVLDALTDRPLPELVSPLPIAPALKAALINRSGPLGALLASAETYEVGDWSGLLRCEFEATELCEAFVAANAWTEATQHALKTAG